LELELEKGLPKLPGINLKGSWGIKNFKTLKELNPELRENN